MRQLFGTDGIRGVAGEYPLDRPTAFAVGVALARWIGEQRVRRASSSEVVIGIDTRESGPWIAEHLAAGLEREGVTARFAGLITTPGLAHAARMGPFAAGVMISASHNPYQDNGIKIIDHSGFKLPDEQEHTIEQHIFALSGAGLRPADPPVPKPLVVDPTLDREYLDASSGAGLRPANSLPAKPLVVDPTLDREYLDFLAATLPGGLAGVRIVVDGAHGSASYLGPELLARLGAKVEAICCSPDGRNINLHCGSQHLEPLRAKVLETGADLGVAFDGDADRALFVSHSGRIVDGDAVLLLTALPLHARGRLTEVVATVMSNLGLERALSSHGIGLVRTAVGDKYVLEEMLRRDAPLGGEQSGHVIFREFSTTGDGLLTALRVLEVMRSTGQDLDRLTEEMKTYPQRLVNVRVRERRPLQEMDLVNREIRRTESEFGDAGRVLVRFSGTEPLARVMVEGPALDRVEFNARAIAAAIRTEIGE